MTTAHKHILTSLHHLRNMLGHMNARNNFFFLQYSTWPSEVWSSHEFGLHVLFLTSVDSIEMSNSTIFKCWMECTNLGTDFLIKRIILDYTREMKEFFAIEKMLLNFDVPFSSLHLYRNGVIGFTNRVLYFSFVLFFRLSITC